MKLLRALLLPLLFASAVLAQAPASEISLLPNGGLATDSATDSLKLLPPYATSTPTTTWEKGMFYFDTNTDPPIFKWCKTASGGSCSAFAAPIGGVGAVYANLGAVPSSATDNVNGHVAWIQSGNVPCIWNDTSRGHWYGCTTGVAVGTATYSDSSYGATLSSTAAAPTCTPGGGGTSFTNGASHQCKVTFYNSTGGDTGSTGSTACAAFTTTSQSVTLTNIATGPTGTTGRNLWCSKSTGGDWLKVDRINDNSTTTKVVGATDANLVLPVPKVNLSGALGSGYSVQDSSAQTLPGGCGSDGSHWACYPGANATSSGSGVPSWSGATTDSTLRLWRDLSSFVGSNFSVQFEVLDITADGSANQNSANPSIVTMRTGNADNAISLNLFEIHAAGTLTSSAALCVGLGLRTAAAGTLSNPNGNCPNPAIITYPYYVRISRRSLSSTSRVGYIVQVSATGNANDWFALNVSTSASGNTAATTIDASTITLSVTTGNEYTQLEWPISANAANTAGQMNRIVGVSIQAE